MAAIVAGLWRSREEEDRGGGGAPLLHRHRSSGLGQFGSAHSLGELEEDDEDLDEKEEDLSTGR